LSSFQQKLLAEGHFPLEDTFDTVIINREMQQKLGDVIPWETSLLLSGQGSFDLRDPENPLVSVKETFSFSRWMRIAAVVEETSFLNEPRIFYSYQAASVFLSQTEATLYSHLVGTSTSWLQILQDASSNEMLSAYHYLVFLQDEKSLEKLYALSQKENAGSLSYEISSHAFSHREALTSIAFVLRIALIFFVVISLIGSMFVLGISGYSSFISKLKESAILLSMGATYQEICSIFQNESMLIGLFSSVFGIFLSLPAQAFLNQFFENNLDIGHPIAIPFINFLGFPFFLVLLIVLFSLGLSLLATGLPIALFHQSNLVACLRDE
jgi:ABC-type antimicrobial peptide transport system permease subunit